MAIGPVEPVVPVGPMAPAPVGPVTNAPVGPCTPLNVNVQYVIGCGAASGTTGNAVLVLNPVGLSATIVTNTLYPCLVWLGLPPLVGLVLIVIS